MLESADPTGIDDQAIDQIVTTTLPNCSLDSRYRSASAILSSGNILDICGMAPVSTPSTTYLLMAASFASSSRIRLAEGRPKSISSPEKLVPLLGP
jgi:hypothetical protein